jgi:hypothetical protein
MGQIGGPVGIKSVQRGTINIAGTAATGTATVTAVDMNKAQLNNLGVRGYNSTNSDLTGAEGIGMGTLVLTNSTTITWDRTVGYTLQSTTGGLTISYELIEWY